MDNEGTVNERQPAVVRRRKAPEPTWRIPTHTAVLMIAVTLFFFDGAQVGSTAFAMAGGFFYAEQFKTALAVAETAGDVAEVLGDARTAGAALTVGAAVTGVGAPVSIGTGLWTGLMELLRQGVSAGVRAAVGWVIDQVQQFFLLFIFLIKTILSWIFLLLGFLTMWLWLTLRGVSIFAGNYIGRKVAASFALLAVGLVPFMNDIPDMTLWISVLILFSWQEDKERHDKLLARHRAEDARMARMRSAYETAS